MNVAYVAAISGMSGAGKTSVVRRAVEILGDAVSLHFDDYVSVSTYPGDLGRWLDEGADVDVWKTPQLIRDIRALRAGDRIVVPGSGAVVAPAEVLLIEEPFGRMRRETEGLIDVAVHIDVPVDVMLARRLLRRLTEEREQLGDRLIETLRGELEHHVENGRRLQVHGAAVIRDAADLVLDGMLSVEELGRRIADEIRRRRAAGSAV